MFFQPVIFRPIRYNLYFIREYRIFSPGLNINFLDFFSPENTLEMASRDVFSALFLYFFHPFQTVYRRKQSI